MTQKKNIKSNRCKLYTFTLSRKHNSSKAYSEKVGVNLLYTYFTPTTLVKYQ